LSLSLMTKSPSFPPFLFTKFSWFRVESDLARFNFPPQINLSNSPVLYFPPVPPPHNPQSKGFSPDPSDFFPPSDLFLIVWNYQPKGAFFSAGLFEFILDASLPPYFPVPPFEPGDSLLARAFPFLSTVPSSPRVARQEAPPPALFSSLSSFVLES